MKTIYLLLFTLIITLVSCQKDFEITDNVVTNVSTADTSAKILLKRFIQLDTTLTAPNDTMFIADYFYDDRKRCVRIVNYNLQDPANKDTFTVYNFYNGTDTNISVRKVYSIREDASRTTDTLIKVFTYNGDGSLLSDSSTVYGQQNGAPLFYKRKRIYQPTASGILAVDFNIAPYYKVNYVIQKDANRNITYQLDSAFLQDVSTGVFILKGAVVNTCTYDTHPNPLYNVAQKIPVLNDWDNEPDFSPGGGFRNNLLTQYKNVTAGSSMGGNIFAQYRYQYDKNGYPVIARYQEAVSPNAVPNAFSKYLFIYQEL
jgi:hypothetical protein